MRTQSNFQDRDGIHVGISWLDRWGIKPPYVPALSLHVAQAASYSPKSSETCIKIGGMNPLGARIQEWCLTHSMNMFFICSSWICSNHATSEVDENSQQPFKLRMFCFFVFDYPQHLVLFEWSKCSQRRLGKSFVDAKTQLFNLGVEPKIGIPQNGWWK